MSFLWVALHVAIIFGLIALFYIISKLMRRIRILEQSRAAATKSLYTELNGVRSQLSNLLTDSTNSLVKQERMMVERLGRIEDSLHHIQQKLLIDDEPDNFEIKK